MNRYCDDLSLLNTSGKVMNFFHKHVFNFFLDQLAITSLQSGLFVPGDSTVNQLVDIY